MWSGRGPTADAHSRSEFAAGREAPVSRGGESDWPGEAGAVIERGAAAGRPGAVLLPGAERPSPRSGLPPLSGVERRVARGAESRNRTCSRIGREGPSAKRAVEQPNRAPARRLGAERPPAKRAMPRGLPLATRPPTKAREAGITKAGRSPQNSAVPALAGSQPCRSNSPAPSRSACPSGEDSLKGKTKLEGPGHA